VGCSVSLTFFVNRFTISKIGAELFPWLFVVRWKWVCRRPVGMSRGQWFLRIFRLLAPPVLLWSKKGAVAWHYSSLGNQSEIKRLFFRVEIVSLDFHSTKYFISGFALCFDIIVMPEDGEVCILYHCLKWLSLRNFTSN
jgi:hypothetical protein